MQWYLCLQIKQYYFLVLLYQEYQDNNPVSPECPGYLNKKKKTLSSISCSLFFGGAFQVSSFLFGKCIFKVSVNVYLGQYFKKSKKVNNIWAELGTRGFKWNAAKILEQENAAKHPKFNIWVKMARPESWRSVL